MQRVMDLPGWPPEAVVHTGAEIFSLTLSRGNN